MRHREPEQLAHVLAVHVRQPVELAEPQCRRDAHVHELRYQHQHVHVLERRHGHIHKLLDVLHLQHVVAERHGDWQCHQQQLRHLQRHEQHDGCVLGLVLQHGDGVRHVHELRHTHGQRHGHELLDGERHEHGNVVQQRVLLQHVLQHEHLERDGHSDLLHYLEQHVHVDDEPHILLLQHGVVYRLHHGLRFKHQQRHVYRQRYRHELLDGERHEHGNVVQQRVLLQHVLQHEHLERDGHSDLLHYLEQHVHVDDERHSMRLRVAHTVSAYSAGVAVQRGVVTCNAVSAEFHQRHAARQRELCVAERVVLPLTEHLLHVLR